MTKILIDTIMLLLVLCAALALCILTQTVTRPDTFQTTPNLNMTKDKRFVGKGWKKCTLSAYESYPTSAKENNEFNGGKWVGCFAHLGARKLPEEWVKVHNIASVHSADFERYKGKLLVVYDNASGRMLVAKVLDMCSDSDSPDCSKNKSHNGNDFLIDLEKYTTWRLLNKKLDVDSFGLRNGQFRVITEDELRRMNPGQLWAAFEGGNTRYDLSSAQSGCKD